MRPPRFTNLFVCFYIWPAVLASNLHSPYPSGCMRMISVLASDAVKPNFLHTIIAIVFSKHTAVVVPARQYRHYRRTAFILHRFRTSSSFCQATVHSFAADLFSRFRTRTISRRISLALSLNVRRATCSTAVKKVLKSKRGDDAALLAALFHGKPLTELTTACAHPGSRAIVELAGDRKHDGQDA